MSNDTFIPMFWTREFNFANFNSSYRINNHAIYLWTIENVHITKYSLHFVCYLFNHLVEPDCCDPEKGNVKVRWVNNVFPSGPERFHRFLMDNDEEVNKIKGLLNELKENLFPWQTLYSYLDSIPTVMTDPDDSERCFTCGSSRKGYGCRNCIHHNIILLEILHRAECWKCFAPSIYVSFPMRIGEMKEYIYFIDLEKRCATLGWEKSHSHHHTRFRERQKHAAVQQRRPLPLMWSIINIFKNCASRQKVPTLLNSAIYLIITKFDMVKLEKEVHLPLLMKNCLQENYTIFVKYTPIFNERL